MDGAFTVTDSTDWLSTSLPTFSPLESALRCQVCKDFFDNPVITSCSHTFCSLCIRRCLSAEGKCPACRAGDQASKLRRNWAIGEVVAAFVAARPEALRIAAEDKREEERPAKRRRVQGLTEQQASQRQTRSQVKTQVTETADVMVIDDDVADGDYEEAEPDDGLVSCPMCDKRMKEESVFGHLDRCDGSKTQSKPHSRTPASILQRPPSRPVTPQLQQERLPELNYSLLSDIQMRKKLKELGIPSTGPKALMVRRHTEWVNLWNANCDSSRPKSKRELLHELDIWERAQGGLVREGQGNAIMKKDFDAVGYQKTNRADFERLIDDARRKAKRRAEDAQQNADAEKQPRIESGDDAEMLTGRPDGQDERPPDGGDIASPPRSDYVNGIPAMPVEGSQNEALLAKSLFGAQSHSAGDSSRARKVPMFTMPSQPVSDVEQTQAGR
ncbi:hypothetical protein ANO11243_030620 [Dothideomycetidae sp. 11243]|nr:hypothetical protein ANO11243_030620 [fungal sp. No.11243]